MEQSETKSCPMCCMNIPAAAKKCPYCRHPQGKLNSIILHPAIGMLFVIIPMIVICSLIGLRFEGMFSDGEKYSDHPNALTVVDSKMSFGEKWCDDQARETVVVLGTIENSSDIVWDDINLEVKFFDANDELIDAVQQQMYYSVVPSRDQATFKINADKQFPKEKYVSHSVRVLFANEKKGFLD